jgi:uncharacterized membrane protein
MNKRWLPLGLSIALVARQIVRLGLAYDALPARMATHFDLAGTPNGFQLKASFAWISVLLCVFMCALFALLPSIMARVPVRLFNMPNKDYWLAPERRADTLARMSALTDWLGFATVGLLVVLFELIIRCNLEHRSMGNEFWIPLLGYHLFMLVWIVSYMRALRLPDGA